MSSVLTLLVLIVCGAHALPLAQQGAVAEALGTAFTAKSTSTRRVDQGATLSFDATITNQGNRYNPSTGQFTCPTTGTYHFFATIISGDKINCWYDLVRGSDVIVMGFADGVGGNFASATVSVTVQCDQNQVVFLRARRDSCTYTADANWGESTFGGYFMY